MTSMVKERKVYLDDIRVIATIFVIGVHTVSLASTLVPADGISYIILHIFNFIFLSCNLFFVLLSGALLLPVQQEKISTFFCKRFTKVAVPFVVYYILYVCAKEGMQWITPKYWRVLFLRIIGEVPEEAPHFWLVYVILGLYLLTPFFRYILKNIPDQVLYGVMAVVFLINGLDTYLPVLGFDSPFTVIVNSFAGVFLLGYFLNEKCNRRTEDIFIIGGIISFVISCFLIIRTEEYQNYIYENAPTMMLFASAIFLLVKRCAKERSKEGILTKIICKYSFSILLIHWGILHYFVKQVLGVNVLSFGIVGGCALMMFLTLVFSLVGSIVIDNTIVRLIHWIGHVLKRAGIYLINKYRRRIG